MAISPQLPIPYKTRGYTRRSYNFIPRAVFVFLPKTFYPSKCSGDLAYLKRQDLACFKPYFRQSGFKRKTPNWQRLHRIPDVAEESNLVVNLVHRLSTGYPRTYPQCKKFDCMAPLR